ncbi:PLD nuclease N-terminal domain-containing protein [Luteimicrobium subarcticum]|uniref:Phospholipase D-like protein n=1 Tax=Luteimicrobium subarcticum TaxID=620910 RepID=A0A2M8W1S2_9MICO|nr:PLD nuclease N-terminal domain-containing protein [Luteimicrobium subarcticum]PJI84865.1 phospholipase D-like protein [Luteimicrobium subarcticum]
MGHKKKWSELSGGQRFGVLVLGVAQLALTVSAYRDLSQRDEDEIEGTKLAWGVAILVNWIGPITYYLKGRKNLGLNAS